MNENLLLQNNRGKSCVEVVLKKSCVTYKTNKQVFDGYVIKDILSFIGQVHTKYKGVNVPISFDFGDIEFKDKLTYVFLEIICYILIKDYNHDIYVRFNTTPSIFTEGIDSSPLLLLRTGEKEHVRKFANKYSFEIYKNHYRRVFTPADMKDEKLSKIMDGIRYFLNFFEVTESCLDKISEVIIELIGNVSEHAGSSCLVDIDVTMPYAKIGEGGTFYGINLIVINFSECLLGELITERVLGSAVEGLERYDAVKEAYDFHRQYFSDKYKKEDFFNIAAFQHKISGNGEKTKTGGTGLTKLVYSLEKRSNAHNCYLISGNRALWFFHELLEYNEDDWIGFNAEKDFISHLPENRTVGENTIFMPGTAYNLNFAMKGKDVNE